jgi:sialic acid synthase SpsE
MDRPLLIAELGVNHVGSVQRAIAMGKEAIQAGADAIKLQYYHTDKLIAYRQSIGVEVTKQQADLLRQCWLGLLDIDRVANALSPVPVFASVFDPEDVRMYKAAGFDWVKLSVEQGQREEMQRAVLNAKFGRVFMSLGPGSDKGYWHNWLHVPFTLLWCPRGYPVHDSAALSLHRLRELCSGWTASPWTAGLSLHPAEDLNIYNVIACAYGAGARVFELHYRQEDQEDCPERAWSVDASEFYTLRALLDDLHSMYSGEGA